MILAAGDPPPGYAVLLERARGVENEEILHEAAAELMRQPFDEESIDEEFDGTIQRLQEAESRRSFELLQEKIGKLGVSGLSGEEKQQYLQVLHSRTQSS